MVSLDGLQQKKKKLRNMCRKRSQKRVTADPNSKNAVVPDAEVEHMNSLSLCRAKLHCSKHCASFLYSRGKLHVVKIGALVRKIKHHFVVFRN